MGTVYVTQDDAFIGKTDERLCVKANQQKLLDVPLIKVDGIVVLGRASVSPAVVMELLERHIPFEFSYGNWALFRSFGARNDEKYLCS
jgi:CRISPR-associated protein Cas1